MSEMKWSRVQISSGPLMFTNTKKVPKMAKKKIKINKHALIPEHKKLSEPDKKQILEKLGITIKELPLILVSDPALEGLNVDVNDVIKIERTSPTAGKTIFYRCVVE